MSGPTVALCLLLALLPAAGTAGGHRHHAGRRTVHDRAGYDRIPGRADIWVETPHNRRLVRRAVSWAQHANARRRGGEEDKWRKNQRSYPVETP